MPIRKVDNKWYWGSQGPFTTKTKAQQVAAAAYAAGYKSEPKKVKKPRSR